MYVTPKGTVRLLDFNPAGGTTSTLLFDWAELPYGLEAGAAAKTSATEHVLDFRIVSDPTGFRPTLQCMTCRSIWPISPLVARSLISCARHG